MLSDDRYCAGLSQRGSRGQRMEEEYLLSKVSTLHEKGPLPYSPIDFPAIFSRRKMDDFLKLLEEESQRIVTGTESHFADGQI